MRRILVTVVTAFAVLVIGAAPASAHTVSGQGATNWRTTLVSVTPAVPGITVKVIELGSRLEVTNTTATDVLALAPFTREPFLKVGPDGVFENLDSPYAYGIRNRNSTVQPPESADGKGPPQWHKIASGTTARWHEHAIHFMQSQPPLAIRQDPGAFHHFSDGEVTLQQGDQLITVKTSLDWVPAASSAPWLALAVVAGLAALATVFIGGGWGRALAVAVAVVVLADFLHALGIGFSSAGGLGTHLTKVLAGSFYSAVGWILGIIAARLLWKRSVDGLYAGIFAALSALIFSGVVDFTTLTRSQAPFAFGHGVDKATVSLALGLGLGITVASIVIIRRETLAYANEHPLESQEDEPSSEAEPSDASLSDG